MLRPNMAPHPPKGSSELWTTDQEERCCPSNPGIGSVYLARRVNLFKNTLWLNDREGNLLKNTVPCCSASTLAHVRSLLMIGQADRDVYTHMTDTISITFPCVGFGLKARECQSAPSSNLKSSSPKLNWLHCRSGLSGLTSFTAS